MEIDRISKLSRNSDEWFNMVDKYYTKTLPIIKAHAEAKMNPIIKWMRIDITNAVNNGTVLFKSDLKYPICKLMQQKRDELLTNA